ncbi:MAG: hypothetical protein IPF93_08100 [Saprospiraceae bacterium]|nr:hypothetical protein [Saprospiraceae bacterium]MBK8779111.1 hypothetical protein [Saprospiraceae bacterium]
MSCIRKPFFYFLLFLSVSAYNNENNNNRSLTGKDHLPIEVLEGKIILKHHAYAVMIWMLQD